MTTIDGDEVAGITIDGETVQEVTVDGDVVWTGKTVVDNFEDGDISEYSGSTSEFYIDSSTVFEGTYSLRGEGGAFSEITSSSGLNYYPQRGDVVRGIVRTNALGFTQMFKTGGGSNRYDLRFEWGTPEIQIQSVVSGSVDSFSNAAISPSVDTWYGWEFDWDSGGNGDLTMRFMSPDYSTEHASATINDTNFDTCEVTLTDGSGSGEAGWWDDIHVI